MKQNTISQKFKLHTNWMIDKHWSIVGEYINFTSLLENSIVSILTVSYCENDISGRMLFTKTLSDKLSLRLKMQSCLAIIKELELLDSKSQDKLRNDFKLINDRRNLLAHSILMSADSYILKYCKKGIHLNGSDVNNPIYLDFEEHKEKTFLLKNTITVVTKLRDAVIPTKELGRRSKL